MLNFVPFGGIGRCFQKYWVFPQIIHFSRVFHYFHHPFWGKHPYFWNTHMLDPSEGFSNVITLVVKFLDLSRSWISWISLVGSPVLGSGVRLWAFMENSLRRSGMCCVNGSTKKCCVNLQIFQIFDVFKGKTFWFDMLDSFWRLRGVFFRMLVFFPLPQPL